MENFNVWYECLDARDDYRAQLLKEEAQTSSWDPVDRDWLLTADTNEDNGDDANRGGTLIQLPDTLSPNGQIMLESCIRPATSGGTLYDHHERDRHEVRITPKKQGANYLSDKDSRVVALQTVPQLRSSAEWTRLVLHTKETILKNKFGVIAGVDKPLTSGNPMPRACYGKPGVVKIIPDLKVFLQRLFDAGESGKYIEDVSLKFKLNEEQE
ncbi:hypothetical protein PM082_019795 [Marasmius tenuissimus]|nr:hypothetical protein PM082_019795 [Marasmius tenuissimus]